MRSCGPQKLDEPPTRKLKLYEQTYLKATADEYEYVPRQYAYDYAPPYLMVGGSRSTYDMNVRMPREETIFSDLSNSQFGSPEESSSRETGSQARSVDWHIKKPSSSRARNNHQASTFDNQSEDFSDYVARARYSREQQSIKNRREQTGSDYYTLNRPQERMHDESRDYGSLQRRDDNSGQRDGIENDNLVGNHRGNSKASSTQQRTMNNGYHKGSPARERKRSLERSFDSYLHNEGGRTPDKGNQNNPRPPNNNQTPKRSSGPVDTDDFVIDPKPPQFQKVQTVRKNESGKTPSKGKDNPPIRHTSSPQPSVKQRVKTIEERKTPSVGSGTSSNKQIGRLNNPKPAPEQRLKQFSGPVEKKVKKKSKGFFKRIFGKKKGNANKRKDSKFRRKYDPPSEVSMPQIFDASDQSYTGALPIFFDASDQYYESFDHPSIQQKRSSDPSGQTPAKQEESNYNKSPMTTFDSVSTSSSVKRKLPPNAVRVLPPLSNQQRNRQRTPSSEKRRLSQNAANGRPPLSDPRRTGSLGSSGRSKLPSNATSITRSISTTSSLTQTLPQNVASPLPSFTEQISRGSHSMKQRSTWSSSTRSSGMSSDRRNRRLEQIMRDIQAQTELEEYMNELKTSTQRQGPVSSSFAFCSPCT